MNITILMVYGDILYINIVLLMVISTSQSVKNNQRDPRQPAVADPTGPRWSTTAGSVGSLEDQHGPGPFRTAIFWTAPGKPWKTMIGDDLY